MTLSRFCKRELPVFAMALVCPCSTIFVFLASVAKISHLNQVGCGPGIRLQVSAERCMIYSF